LTGVAKAFRSVTLELSVVDPPNFVQGHDFKCYTQVKDAKHFNM